MRIADYPNVMMKNSAVAQKRGNVAMCRPALTPIIAAIASAAASVAGPMTVAKAQAQRGEVAITCTNPYSGASWQIHVDYDRSTVDSNQAKISEDTISWRAQNGWNYSLDRASGKLTVILASATGGNFLYDQCKLDH
jgi:hypothetical protein